MVTNTIFDSKRANKNPPQFSVSKWQPEIRNGWRKEYSYREGSNQFHLTTPQRQSPNMST